MGKYALLLGMLAVLVMVPACGKNGANDLPYCDETDKEALWQ